MHNGQTKSATSSATSGCNVILYKFCTSDLAKVQLKGATFRADFVAPKVLAETNQSLWYKLQMMGVPIEGPTFSTSKRSRQACYKQF